MAHVLSAFGGKSETNYDFAHRLKPIWYKLVGHGVAAPAFAVLEVYFKPFNWIVDIGLYKVGANLELNIGLKSLCLQQARRNNLYVFIVLAIGFFVLFFGF